MARLKIHLISYTPLDAPGGVPRFNRLLKQALEETGWEVFHWSWWDAPADCAVIADRYWSEDKKAQALSRHLHVTGKVHRDDVIIGDGFWCGDFALMGYRRVVSVAHGIWGHVTYDDVLAGIQPENHDLHIAQITHRRDHQRRGLPIVAVSRFIQKQMDLQWGFESKVINNAIDPDSLGMTDEDDDDWWQQFEDHPINTPVVIVHGVNDRSNGNKGWSHIEAVQRMLDNPMAGGHHHGGMGPWPMKMMFGSLDELQVQMGMKNKMNVMRHASLAVIPSGYEGNSYFALELLNAGVPIVAYDVGLFYQMSRTLESELVGPFWSEDNWMYKDLGIVVPRKLRSPEMTANMTDRMLCTGRMFLPQNVQKTVQEFASLDRFQMQWVEVIEGLLIRDILCLSK